MCIRDRLNGRRTLLFAALAVMATQPVVAQIGSATISGSVTDSTGASVSAAIVTALNVANNFRRVTTSNAAGQYSLPGLTPGEYNLTVELQGFKKFQQTAMTLQVDQNAVIDVVLEVGQVTEIVEVRGQAPLVESANASMGAVIDTQKITTLPLNGRNFVQLALLVPEPIRARLALRMAAAFPWAAHDRSRMLFRSMEPPTRIPTRTA